MSKEAAKTAKDMLVKKEGATTRSVARSLHAMGLTKRALHGTTISRHAKAAKADGTTLAVGQAGPATKGPHTGHQIKAPQICTGKQVSYVGCSIVY